MKRTLIEIVGWSGMVAIVAAYALVSFSLLSPRGAWYQALNGAGALGVLVAAFSKRDYPAGALNLVWAAIAAGALIRTFL